MMHFAVIGHPLKHTMSPFIHKFIFDISGTSADYTAIDVSPENFSDDYKNILSKLDGYNVTIPHKQTIIPYLDTLNDRAKMYHSVNTVLNCDGISSGYTTDPLGFLTALKYNKAQLCGDVLILGCGGVARTFAFEAAIAGCSVTFAVRSEDLDCCKNLVSEIKSKTGAENISYYDIKSINKGFDMVVNGTPVGMFPHIDAQPICDDVIKKSKAVFDAVYNPLKTNFIKKAESFGITAIGGLDMLVFQAVESQKIWNVAKFSDSDIDLLLKAVYKEMEKNNG